MSPVVVRPEDMPDVVAARLKPLDEERRLRFILHAVAEFIENESEAKRLEEEWWQSLSPAQQEAERDGLRLSLANADAGRVSPAEDVFARIRTRSSQKAV